MVTRRILGPLLLVLWELTTTVTCFHFRFRQPCRCFKGQQSSAKSITSGILVNQESREEPLINRRSFIIGLLCSVFVAATAKVDVACAEAIGQPTVTKKVFMDVRVSRSDGTFYVRDDLPETPENRVFYGRLVLGLFGDAAPTPVEQFLSYVDVPYRPLEENPLPSYGRSNFRSLDQRTGVLYGGYIPSLQLTNIGGGAALQYGGKILPAPLWIEKRPTEKVSHSTKWLLTHRTLDLLPIFGITTRACPELDATNVVFGKVLPDESSNEFFELVQDIPTYSVDRPVPAQESAVDEVAASVFNAQRDFFRSAAKTFGDTRIDKVYQGKFLRRVEVTRVVLAR